jgi:hypothetical protein
MMRWKDCKGIAARFIYIVSFDGIDIDVPPIFAGCRRLA